MFILGQLLSSLAGLLDVICTVFYFLFIARIFLSWVNPDPYNPIVEFIYKVTEPILGPIRRIIPLQVGMIDLSPIIAFIALDFLRRFIVGSLYHLATRFM
ncbi:MAG: YggT family protein [bacterium]|nr:YggT family protein [bacterium]